MANQYDPTYEQSRLEDEPETEYESEGRRLMAASADVGALDDATLQEVHDSFLALWCSCCGGGRVSDAALAAWGIRLQEMDKALRERGA